MKHLKTYEYRMLKYYKKGDYISLNINKIKEENRKHDFTLIPSDNLAYIFNVDTIDGQVDSRSVYPYHVLTSDNYKIIVKQDEISGLLTDDEIEEYETRKDIKTYNL